MTFDRTLIDPPADDLASALVDAVASVAVMGNVDTLDGPLVWDEWRRELPLVALRVQHDPEGDHLRQHGTLFWFRVVWATDYRRRKLVRIEAGVVIPFLAHLGVGVQAPPWPPLGIVLRERAIFFQADEATPHQMLLMCSCGALGRPAEIAWMDDRCGPCHDRREAGVPLPEPFTIHNHKLAVPDSVRYTSILARSSDGNWVALGDRPLLRAGMFQEVALARLPGGKVRKDRVQKRLPAGHGLVGADFTLDSQRVVLLCRERSDALLRVYDLRTFELRASIPLRGAPECVAMAPEPETAFVSSGFDIFRVDLRGHLPSQCLPERRAHRPAALPTLALACSPDGRWLASLDRDQIALRDRQRDEIVAQEPHHGEGGYLGITFTPDSSLLLMTTGGGGIELRDVPSLRFLGQFLEIPLARPRLFFDDPWLTVVPLSGTVCRRWPLPPLLDFVQRERQRIGDNRSDS
jgi:hypothetical protein